MMCIFIGIDMQKKTWRLGQMFVKTNKRVFKIITEQRNLLIEVVLRKFKSSVASRLNFIPLKYSDLFYNLYEEKLRKQLQ